MPASAARISAAGTPQWVTTVAAGLALVGGSALLDGRSGPAAVFALLALCATFLLATSRVVSWNRAGLALLVAASLCDRFAVLLGGLHVKAETAAVPLVVLVALGVLVRERRIPAFTLADWLLGGWVVANALGSLSAPVRGTSLKLTLQLALLFAGYLALRQLLRSGFDLRFAFLAMLGGLTLVAAVGVIAYVLYPLGLNLGIQIDPITHRPTAYATLFEGNLFGSSVMVAWFWWLVALMTSSTRRWLAVVGLVITTAGVEVSLARGTWLAIAVTLVVGVAALFTVRRPTTAGLSRRVADLGLAAGVALLLSVVVWSSPAVRIDALLHPPAQPAAVASSATASRARSASNGSVNAAPAVIQRATTLSGPRADATIIQRFQTVRTAVRDWSARPLTGLGPGSYGESYIDTSHQPAWIGILPIRILHDTGILGVLVFVALGVLLSRGWVDALRHCTVPWLRYTLIAQGLAIVALLVAYTATEGLELLFAWLVLGLFVATIEIARADSPVLVDAPS